MYWPSHSDGHESYDGNLPQGGRTIEGHCCCPRHDYWSLAPSEDPVASLSVVRIVCPDDEG